MLAVMANGQLTQSTDKLTPCGPIPNENQLRWQDMEMYAFIHYSLNTYTDEEWGFGNEDLKLFNPSNLDCRQWARVCKQAGMRVIIFTAKHHCGFCMWPSAYTEYSVKNTPWKNGKGDVVRELADACREEGLEFAVYLSPWDRNHPEYGRPEYVTYFRNQLRELLTNYGEIFEVWFPNVKATKLRFTVTDTKAAVEREQSDAGINSVEREHARQKVKCEPIIKKLGVYLAPELTADIPNSGEKKSSDLHIFFSNPCPPKFVCSSSMPTAWLRVIAWAMAI